MTSYYKDNWDFYFDKKFNLIDFSKDLLNNNALINGAGLLCGIISILVVL